MENILKIKGIIFDYGGTIDSRGDHWSEVIWRGYRAAGVEIDKSTFRDAYVYAERELARTRHILPHHNFLDLLRIKMALEFGWLQDNGHLAACSTGDNPEKVALYCYEAAKESIAEARPTLDYLYERYPMVLVSNFYGNVEAVLTDFELRRYFRAIIESAVVGIRKPDPAIFSLGVDALALSPDEVLVVGDSLRKDILPAESIGCQTAWLKGKGWTAEEDAAIHPSQISSLEALRQML
ncbi:MAG: HAD family hydrolase [Pseudoflavonifractor sp.]|nr:HAD family hydrolase [Alloprevotella sp.]MCM1116225.1 HAD family hydrolase [Pseudoflavonifractor sp.]